MNKTTYNVMRFLLLIISCIPITAFASNIGGDVNNDGEVNIADVNAIIDVVLGGSSNQRADVNYDGEVNIADVNTIINIILGGTAPTPPDILKITVNGQMFKMIKVEGGTFLMGALDSDNNASSNSKPAHQVTITGDYYIGRTEVTQNLWKAVMNSNPSDFTGNLNRPVESINWHDCQDFIIRLNKLTGMNFRLPTEAEWELAARGGKKTMYYWWPYGNYSLNDVAWYYDNSNQITHSVGSKPANDLGLYDMLGNVWEWCLDYFSDYSNEALIDPIGPFNHGSSNIIRGGSWVDQYYTCSVVSRGYHSYSKYNDIGLRLALDMVGSTKFRLSETVVSIEVGKSTNVSILNGSGNYTVHGYTGFATCTTRGNILTISGTTVSNLYEPFFITDVATGTSVMLPVKVTESTDPPETPDPEPPGLEKEEFTVNGVCFSMVKLEGGTFMMGSDNNSSESPVHKVTLSDYSISQTEVTQALWIAVMGSNPSMFTSGNGHSNDLRRPVENVSWDDCQNFISKLNELTGKTFRLPTEAEWEFAARGGNRSQGCKYSGSNTLDKVAWYYYDLDSIATYPVATKSPNELGLYDMSGNVWEWVQDRGGYYSGQPQTNPTGPATGSFRVYRGGSFIDSQNSCTVTRRTWDSTNQKTYSRGLRLAL